MMIQSKPEKQDESQISEKKFYVSDFELKFYNASNFESVF